MTKGERRRFYKELDAKYDIVAGVNELHSCAGIIVQRLGLKQSYELLGIAESLAEWITLCKAHLEKAGKSVTGIDSPLEKFVQTQALVSAIYKKYALPEDNRELHTVVAKFIQRLGVKRCSKFLREQKSFPDWLERCKLFRRKLGTDVHKPRTDNGRQKVDKRRQLTKQEIARNRKEAIEWQRQKAEDRKRSEILERKYGNPVQKAQKAILEQLDWQQD